jgi:alkanesulfonate monooxygenase SsuD/methylene tetrahydromethanopterin reductase-like flavin-dependent oxidoreductase (luciferase family)
VRLGLLVGANPFRNPGLVAKMAATVDHVSDGRLVLGLGAGNREAETRAHGLDPGRSVGERLDWLDESLTIIRGLLAGETVTHASAHYRFDAVAHAPRPVQARVPVVIGASGEKRGLRLVARHADLWHQWLGPDEVEVYQRKRAVLEGHLEEADRPRDAVEHHVGGRVVIRDTAAEARRIFEEQVRLHGWGPEMTSFAFVGTADEVAGWIARYRDAGVHAFSGSVAAPLDLESIERLAVEVRPLVDTA